MNYDQMCNEKNERSPSSDERIKQCDEPWLDIQ